MFELKKNFPQNHLQIPRDSLNFYISSAASYLVRLQLFRQQSEKSARKTSSELPEEFAPTARRICFPPQKSDPKKGNIPRVSWDERECCTLPGLLASLSALRRLCVQFGWVRRAVWTGKCLQNCFKNFIS